MGKARTYSEPTDYRQHAVRLRALKDNPRNPAELGAIGPQGDWAVDDPSAIVEEGSNSNGSYVMYTGGRFDLQLIVGSWGTVPPSTDATLTKYLPLVLDNTLYFVTATDYQDAVCIPRLKMVFYKDRIAHHWQNKYTSPVPGGHIFVKVTGDL